MLFYSLYLDAQVGGLVTSLTHRGNPLNFTLSPVADETDLYATEAGEWRLMFNRESQFTEYLGNQDKNGYYFGISHKVTVDRVKEARTRRWRGLDIFLHNFCFRICTIWDRNWADSRRSKKNNNSNKPMSMDQPLFKHCQVMMQHPML